MSKLITRKAVLKAIAELGGIKKATAPAISVRTRGLVSPQNARHHLRAIFIERGLDPSSIAKEKPGKPAEAANVSKPKSAGVLAPSKKAISKTRATKAPVARTRSKKRLGRITGTQASAPMPATTVTLPAPSSVEAVSEKAVQVSQAPRPCESSNKPSLPITKINWGRPLGSRKPDPAMGGHLLTEMESLVLAKANEIGGIHAAPAIAVWNRIGRVGTQQEVQVTLGYLRAMSMNVPSPVMGTPGGTEPDTAVLAVTPPGVANERPVPTGPVKTQIKPMPPSAPADTTEDLRKELMALSQKIEQRQQESLLALATEKAQEAQRALGIAAQLEKTIVERDQALKRYEAAKKENESLKKRLSRLEMATSAASRSLAGIINTTH